MGNEPKEPVTSTDTFSLDEQHRQDSIKIQELALQLQEMKLNEILLKDELESTKNSNTTADSLKRAEQQNRIDSLRTLTPGVPVVVEGDTLFYLYAKRGGRTPVDRAEDILNIMVKIGTSHSLKKDSIYIYDSEYVTDIMYGEKVILSITDQDALWQNLSRIALAEQYQPIIQNKIQELREQHSILQIAKRVLLFILVIIIQYFLFKLTNYLFKKLRRKIIWLKQNRLRSITIRDYEFLNTHRQGRVLMFFTNVIRWIVLLIQLTISVPILFAIFPQTEDLALKIFSYLLEPVKMIFKSVGSYIPNLFIILVIYYCIKYIVKGIQYIANEIESENLKISGFYPDWAQPTFNIIRFLLYAFMIAMIYPYLPGSDSGVFQGISVFVGLIISLGSSTVIGNIIAGLVITYMRPFKLGDRIQLNETTGNVIEKTPFVTRLRTPKNEVVTIPNSFIMSSHTTNYSASARQYGLIIHSTVTIGYDVPWRQVHQLLINAARQTTGVLPEPKPFVLETELSDYYPCYQINAYIKDADKLGDIYSDLHQNIQDVFNEAGVEIMSPHYFARRDGSASTIPASPYPDDRVEPSKK
nr:mechanosensitive ion channel family protein [Parabacteroides distasonis]